MAGILRRTGLAAVALCAIAKLTATPVDAGGVVTTSMFLPLQGSVVNPAGACAGEQVALSGMIHVVSIFVPPTPIIPPDPIKLHFNMAGVLGTGLSGNTYVATGAAQADVIPPTPIVPPSPIVPPTPIFQLEGTGSCAGQAQLPVNFDLLFDAGGHLLPGSGASLVCLSDVGCS